MKLRFTTSVATARGYFHEGRVIEVDTVPSEFKDFLRQGLVVPVKDVTEEIAVRGTDDQEHAVRPRRRSSRAEAVA